MMKNRTIACAPLGMAAILLTLLLPQSLAAQQVPVSPADRETISQLKAQIAELSVRLKQLEARLGPPSETATAPTAPPAPAPQEEVREPDVRPQAEPRTQLNWFGDAGYRASTLRGSTNSFSIGHLDMVITSQLSDKLSVLGDVLFEVDQGNKFIVDIERLYLKYSASEYFNLSVGRYVLATGFYARNLHEGAWLRTTVDQPFIFFGHVAEDVGGLVPTHAVGASVDGAIPSGSLGLHYAVAISNGRTSRSLTAEPVQSFADENNRKALNFALYVRPRRWRGFEMGFSIYRDKLTPASLPPVGQTIISGYFAYQRPAFEWITETHFMRNTPAAPGFRRHTASAFYTEFWRRFGPTRPYFRYQYVNVADGDLIVGSLGLRHGPTAGLRYDFAESAALKFEYERTMHRRTDSSNVLKIQFSFTF